MNRELLFKLDDEFAGRIQVGDRVAYSVQFLRSIYMSHSSMSRARGVIIGFIDFGSIKLATIHWNDNSMPKKVNVKNLSLVGPNRRFCNVD